MKPLESSTPVQQKKIKNLYSIDSVYFKRFTSLNPEINFYWLATNFSLACAD